MRLVYKVLAGIVLLSMVLHRAFYRVAYTPPRKKPNTMAEIIKLREVSPDQRQGFLIEAGTMQLEDDDIICEDVTCTMITENQDSAYFNAKKTKLNTITRDLVLENTVSGTFNDFTVQGSNFEYNFENQTVTTSETTTLSHPQMRISSEKTEINLQNNQVELYNVDSDFYPSNLPGSDNSK